MMMIAVNQESVDNTILSKYQGSLYLNVVQLEYGTIRHCEFCFQWSTVIPLSVAAYKSQDFSMLL